MISRRILAGGLLAAPALLPGRASAQARTVRFTLDWAMGGTTAFANVASRRGYFTEEGLDVRVNRGFGSGRVPVDIAGGAYDMGFGDFSTMAKFAAENPGIGLLAVMMLYDGLPLVCTARAEGPIRTPKDLEGKRIAAPEGDAGRQVFPVFAEAAGFDARSVTWISVSPELREPMLVRGQADAITGFITSTSMSLRNLGVPVSAQRIFRYAEFGVPLYSNCVMTTRRYAEANPEAVRGVLRALARGTRMVVTDPEAAVAATKEIEPLVDVAMEADRARIAAAELIMTDNVRRNGLSAVDPARMERGLDILARVYSFPRRPAASELYTDAYLPDAARRAMA